MNITEKILARGAGESKLEPGDVKFAKIDKVMSVSYTHLTLPTNREV